MKKSLRKLLNFLIVLAILVAIYFTLRLFPGLKLNQPDSTLVSEESVLVLPKEQIQGVRILSQGQVLDFLRVENRWQMTGYTYPLSSVVMNALIANLTNFEAKLLAQAQDDLSVYGLDIPRKTVEISMKNGEKNLLLFGNETPLGTHYYIQVHGKPEVFLVPREKWDLFSVNRGQYWDVSMPVIDWQNITHASIRFAQTPPIELQFREKAPMFMRYEFIYPAPYRGFFANSSAFYRLWQDWAQNPPQKQHLEMNIRYWSTYGLQPPRLAFSVSDKNGNNLDIEIGHRTQSGDYYARLPKTNYVFALSKNYVQDLFNLTPFALLNKFVALIPKDDVSFFILTTPEEAFWGKIVDIRQLHKMNAFTWHMSLFHNRSISYEKPKEHQKLGHKDHDKEIQYYFNGFPVKDEDFLSAYQRMISLSYEAEAQRPASLKPQVMYQLRYYHKDKGLMMTIDFLSYNTQYYLVRINGHMTQFLVGQYQLKELTEIFQRL